ncbi:glycosyltransferase family protein [Desertibaculum subflavum]|uniref:glycosyltransferase family protein n=1 Tax=Desertibaculum subflavum TaxID=2268458 RepID=UPI000E66AF20
MTKRVLFYVQHLLGIGHLKRAATLARGLAADGLDVTLVSGGFPVPELDTGGARFVQLPPVRATDLYFKVLVDEAGTVIDDAWRERRREALLALWRDVRPHLLMLELYPFGRRQMRFELVPLLDAAIAAAERPVVVSSVRDILVAAPKPERNVEMVEQVERYFDHVLVHGDPGLIPFERTFPLATRIADRLHPTGYVVDRSRSHDPAGPGAGEVIVSAGGGAVGEHLLETAIQARPHSAARDLPWRVLVGVNLPDETLQRLAALGGAGVKVERARGDFAALLARCRLSISQGGYNTVMEIMSAGCRAVVVPYAGGLETEQTLRAELLAARGAFAVLPEGELAPETLATKIDAALAMPPPAEAQVDMNGLAASRRLVAGWVAEVGW